MYTPGTIANSQSTPTEVNKGGSIATVRILVKQVDTVKHLKRSRIFLTYNASFTQLTLMIFEISADIFTEML